jgi:hypothetical protein
MANESITNEKDVKENTAIELFLDDPNSELFAALFNIFSPQLISFFRAPL